MKVISSISISLDVVESIQRSGQSLSKLVDGWARIHFQLPPPEPRLRKEPAPKKEKPPKADGRMGRPPTMLASVEDIGGTWCSWGRLRDVTKTHFTDDSSGRKISSAMFWLGWTRGTGEQAHLWLHDTGRDGETEEQWQERINEAKTSAWVEEAARDMREFCEANRASAAEKKDEV